jgi:hypothetical protein
MNQRKNVYFRLGTGVQTRIFGCKYEVVIGAGI